VRAHISGASFQEEAVQIISRKAAKAAGLKYYFTGKPCKRGHIDQRFVSSFMCFECGRDKTREAYRALDIDQRRAGRDKRKAYVQQWRASNRERLLAYYGERNKRYKEQQPDYFKHHYASNRERKKRQSLEWYRANAEYALERQKAYAAKRLADNPEHVRAIGRRNVWKRRAIQKQVFVEVVDPRVVFERDKGICGICLKAVDPTSRWEVDHIIPLSKKGEHSYANCQLTHRKCNRSKAAKLLIAS
jgi:5-methylcytosine-specific restriction endonuclease McrA